MMNRLGFLLLIVAFVCFTAVALDALSEDSNPRLEGVGLLTSGLILVAFARPIADAQLQLAEKLHLPSFPSKPRPFTAILLGSGFALLGVLMLLGL